MDNFVNLHVHSDWSALDGIIKIPDMMKRIQYLEQPAIGLSDHGTIAGTYEFLKAAKNSGIPAVPGIEAYVDDIFINRDDKDRQYYHMCIWATDEAGLSDLIKLSSAAWRFNFYYKPRLNREMMQDLGKNLICTSGCLSGQFSKLVQAGNMDEAERLIDFLKRNFKQVYMEIQAAVPADTDYSDELLSHQRLVNNIAIQMAHAYNLPLLATSDAHYVESDDYHIHEVWLALQSKKTINDPKRFKFDLKDAHLRTRADMENSFYEWYPDISDKIVKTALDNSVELGQATKVNGYKTFTSLTPKLLPEDEAFDKLCKLSIDGYKRLITRKTYEKYAAKKGVTVEEAEKVYKDRLKRELEQIKKQGFVDYFLLVHELLDWCEQNDIYRGAARGSAASSLVSYLIGITKVIDPLEHDLVFERFIAPGRISSPDIDLDFAADQRDLVFDHIFERWGTKNTAHVGTAIKSKAKLVLKDIARACNIPNYEIKPVQDVVIQRAGGDARASETLEETFASFKEAKDFDKKYPWVLPMALKLEGCVRGFGQHAAGVLITPDKLENYVPIEKRKDKFVCAFDGETIDKMGFLKLDILSIDALDLLRDIANLVEKRQGIKIDYWSLPLDDSEVYKAFARADLLGVFQFQKSLGMANICRKAPIEEFQDIVNLSSLYRPGGMRSGAADQYLNVRAGRVKPISVHPFYDKITADTRGVIVYQEQIMAIFSTMGGFPNTRVDEGRKAIAKSHGLEAFDRFYPDFLEGCLKNGISEELAKELFGQMRASGSYLFNRAHAVSYTLLSYYSQYMKVHYPLEFWTCFLNREEDESLIQEAVQSLINNHGEFLPLDVNKSEQGFSIDGNKIRAGSNKLKWCSPAAWQDIVKNRPYTSYEDFCDRTTKRIVNLRVKKNLLIAGAFDELIGKEQVNKLLNMDDESRQFEAASIYPSFSGIKRIDLYKDVIDSIREKHKIVRISTLREGYQGLFYAAGIITETRFNRVGDFDKAAKTDEEKEIILKRDGWIWGARFIDFDLDDGTDHTRLRINPDFYDVFGNYIRNGNAVLVRGVFTSRVIRNENGERVLTGGGIGYVNGIEYLDSIRVNEPTNLFGEHICNNSFFKYPESTVPITKADDSDRYYGYIVGWKNFLRKKDQARYGILDIQFGNKLVKGVMWADDWAKYEKKLKREIPYMIDVRLSEQSFFDTKIAVKKVVPLKDGGW